MQREAGPSALRSSLEIIAILALTPVGLLLGGLSGSAALSSLTGVALSVGAATLFLRASGESWRGLGFGCAMPVKRFVGFTAAALLGSYAATTFLVTPIMKALGAPPLEIGLLTRLIEGDLVNFLIFLLPIAWGSAAFGEELIARGFILHRFSSLFGDGLAIVAQAALFALAHAYQGPVGMANIFALALVFGVVYVRCGRNLWPVIVAHGLVDTVGITLIYLGKADLLLGAG